MNTKTPIPRQKAPGLDVALTNGSRYVLGQQPGENFDLLVFYRGLHCPICVKYLTEFERLAPEFKQRGVELIALSCDDADRGKQMVDKIEAKGIAIGYGLALTTARDWGLFISASRGKTSTGLEEPAHFSEPGAFLIKPDGTLFYSCVQTAPFARPSFQDLLGAVDFAIAKGLPARGEYTGPV